MAQYSKAIAAALPLLVLVLNQLLPVTNGSTKAYVNLALAVVTLLSVYYSPKNAEAPAKASAPKPY